MAILVSWISKLSLNAVVAADLWTLQLSSMNHGSSPSTSLTAV